MSNEDEMITVFRLLEYTGTRADVEKQVKRSIQGSMNFGSVQISARTVSENADERVEEVSSRLRDMFRAELAAFLGMMQTANEVRRSTPMVALRRLHEGLVDRFRSLAEVASHDKLDDYWCEHCQRVTGQSRLGYGPWICGVCQKEKR